MSDPRQPPVATVPLSRHAVWLARTDVRLALWGLVAVASVYAGFLGVSVAMADLLVKRYGYYLMWATFAGWGAVLWRLRAADTRLLPPRRELVIATLVITVFTFLALTSDVFRCKILYDEFVLQSTAFNLHFFRDVATMVRGYDILGVFVSTDNYLDKRPYFYPFLLSLVHDLTGYRSSNGFALNAALLPLTLGLVYYLGRQLAAARGGLLAVLLLGSLPLLGQNATGSGMELLNITMILTVVALSGAYLRRPDELRLSSLVLGAVLLAQTRYESAIYVLPVALIVLVGWWRVRRVVLSWPAMVAPLLLVPCALQNKVLAHSPLLWELNESQSSRFSTEYLAKNLRGARNFFFSTNGQLANSWLLAFLGFGAIAWLLVRLARRPRQLAAAGPDQLALLLVSLGVAANTVLVLFYYWASFDDPMASRFSLPLHVILAFAVVQCAGMLDRKLPATAVLLALAGTFACSITTAQIAYHHYSNLGNVELEWEKRVVASLPPGDRLVITNKSSLPWLLEKIPSILIDRARLVADRLDYQLHEPTFREILVTQSLRPSTADGDHQLTPEDRLPPGYRLEPIVERRFGTKIARISRLVGITLPDKPAAPVPEKPRS